MGFLLECSLLYQNEQRFSCFHSWYHVALLNVGWLVYFEGEQL